MRLLISKPEMLQLPLPMLGIDLTWTTSQRCSPRMPISLFGGRTAPKSQGRIAQLMRPCFLTADSRVLSHRLSNWLLALHRCNYTWTLTGASAPDGAPAGTRQGILLLVVKEEQSGWQTKLAQNTDVVPGALAPLLTKKGESLAHVTTSASRARSLCA